MLILFRPEAGALVFLLLSTKAKEAMLPYIIIYCVMKDFAQFRCKQHKIRTQ
jgi:hypothetical protein